MKRNSASTAKKVVGQRTTRSKSGAGVAVKSRSKATSAPTNSKPVSKRRSKATDEDPIQFVEEDKPLPKTSLTDEQLGEFRQMLLAKRAELIGDVERMSDGAFNRTNSSAGDHSTMPIHMADLGSDNWEQDFTIGLIANERALVLEIDEALARTEDRTYGMCLATRKRITLARLRAKPWAKYCIEHARAREEGRAF